MKFIRASRAKGPSNRSEAWDCFMANLALPGAGSLAAGKAIGYYQLVVTATGLLVSLVSGCQLLIWTSRNWAVINNPGADPFATLATVWREIRWPLAGLGIFAIALLWGAITGLQILSAHPKTPVPPRIV